MPRPLDNFTPNRAALGYSREPLLTLDLSVITPLFGGGAVAREVDLERPVSAKTVRGHLRFWWRACRSTGYATVHEFFEAEARIWGSTENPAAVQISVEIINRGRPIQWAEFEMWNGQYRRLPTPRSGYPGYALFPFQGKATPAQIVEQPATALEGVRFRLRLDVTPAASDNEEIRKDVEAAVWAWVLLGGVGARTRRGCGTLFCLEERFRPSPALLMHGPAQHVLEGERTLAIPCLSGARVITRRPPGLPTMQAWQMAVEAMQGFRQGAGFARSHGQQANRPGRSRWPEADSIRRFTGVADPIHRPCHPAGDYFPRADLGLPIVFQFQSRHDPSVHNLQALVPGATRMASPIILKAFPLSASSAVPMVVLLNAPHVWDGGVPNVGFSGYALPATQLRDATKSSSVPPLAGNVIVREAFLDFTKKKWNGLEVTLP